MRKILLITLGLSVALLADFTRDNGTKIVTDNTTGLQWQDDVNITKDWVAAITYCEELTLGGYDDWRLPNFNELYSIGDRSKSHPAMDSAFQNVVSGNYWSSTSAVVIEYYAWLVDFSDGKGRWYGKRYNNYVLCVRDGQ